MQVKMFISLQNTLVVSHNLTAIGDRRNFTRIANNLRMSGGSLYSENRGREGTWSHERTRRDDRATDKGGLKHPAEDR